MKKLLARLLLTSLLAFCAIVPRATLATCSGGIPYIFTDNVSYLTSATTNANNNFLLSCATSVDNTQVGSGGIYASQIKPNNTTQATFGSSQTYSFPSNLNVNGNIFAGPSLKAEVSDDGTNGYFVSTGNVDIGANGNYVFISKTDGSLNTNQINATGNIIGGLRLKAEVADDGTNAYYESVGAGNVDLGTGNSHYVYLSATDGSWNTAGINASGNIFGGPSLKAEISDDGTNGYFVSTGNIDIGANSHYITLSSSSGALNTAQINASGNIFAGPSRKAELSDDGTNAYLESTGNVYLGANSNYIDLDTTGALNTGRINASSSYFGTTGSFSGNLTSSATIQGATLTSTGNINATSGTITGGTLTSNGNVNATSGTVSASAVTASGTVSGGTLTSSGGVNGASANISGTITSGSHTVTGNVTATGNVTGVNLAFGGTCTTGGGSTCSVSSTNEITGASCVAMQSSPYTNADICGVDQGSSNFTHGTVVFYMSQTTGVGGQSVGVGAGVGMSYVITQNTTAHL